MNRAPAILAGVWMLTLVAGLPLAAALRGALADHLGESLAADSAAAGANYDWMQEFADQASGIGVTFKPTVIGFGAVLDNLSAFIDDTARPVAIVATASLYVLSWIFLAGGIVDRFARDRAIGAHGFFAACGVFFFRFLRLASVQWLIYAFLFTYLHGWLFGIFYPRITHEMNVERTAFLTRLALYLVFGLLVAAAALVFDYAKVRAVVEDRRSMLSAIGAALWFIRRNTAAAVGVFAANFILFVVVVGAYALVAPGAGGPGPSMWVGFAVGQLYILGRLCVKLVFWASETSLFQSRLAHAGYVARPAPVWPDSPVAEAIRSQQTAAAGGSTRSSSRDPRVENASLRPALSITASIHTPEPSARNRRDAGNRENRVTRVRSTRPVRLRLTFFRMLSRADHAPPPEHFHRPLMSTLCTRAAARGSHLA